MHLGLRQTSMKFHAKIVNSFYPLNIFLESSIIDIWQGPKYTSDTIFAVKSHWLKYWKEGRDRV